MKVVLVCNYPPDAQQSMLRFGELLRRGLEARGWAVAEARPRPNLLRLLPRRASPALGKWIGYVDKYLFFPRELARRVRAETYPGRTIVHVVDHSNAVYVPRRPSTPWVVTCHDLLAVRGALGEDTDCPASWLGRRLQRSIVGGLGRATAVACDSTSTFGDLTRLVPCAQPQLRRVILLGQNQPCGPVERTEALARLQPLTGIPWHEPFLLHVGSNLRRKNKAGVLRIFDQLHKKWSGNLVFGGAPLPDELRGHVAGGGGARRVFAVPHFGEAQLAAAYSLAHALVFPSVCEGFGWPVIEAQACGCPVICSDRTSLPEVGGDAALVFPLGDEAGMADAVLRLTEPDFRAEIVQRGLANAGRFSQDRMLDEYVELYTALF